MARLRALGLMSGTSMDGVDIAYIETDGDEAVTLGPSASFPYPPEDRALLRAAVSDAVGLAARDARPGRLAAAEAVVTRRHAEAIRRFLADCDRPVDVVGFHGQTVLHRPDRQLTVQIGDGAALAAATGLTVAYDFRAADVAAGGQGAPLVPAFHRALVRSLGAPGPVVVVNIGGVANLTFVAPDDDPIACDTGPGNALIDDLMLERLSLPLDRDGATAAQGHVDEAALADLMAHPFFALPPPKSLDRNAFSRARVRDMATADAVATLTAWTAEAVAHAVARLPAAPLRAIVCGGGAHNAAMMAQLTRRLPCPVTTGDACGWSGDAVEAQAFAYLAVRHVKGLPITFPTTTGVGAPLPGGCLASP